MSINEKLSTSYVNWSPVLGAKYATALVHGNVVG